MSKKMYCITTGDYEDLEIFACFESKEKRDVLLEKLGYHFNAYDISLDDDNYSKNNPKFFISYDNEYKIVCYEGVNSDKFLVVDLKDTFELDYILLEVPKDVYYLEEKEILKLCQDKFPSFQDTVYRLKSQWYSILDIDELIRKGELKFEL